MRVITCVVVLYCGCGQHDGSETGLQITVHDAVQALEVGEIPARGGEFFIVVDLEVVNRTKESLRLLPNFFTLRTTQGLEYLGDQTTFLHASGCHESAALLPGSSNRCTIVFRVASDAVATTIRYQTVTDTSRTDAASAPVSVVSCTICDRESCTYLDRDSKNCGACRQDIRLGRCVDGKPACQPATLCGRYCVDILTDRFNCGGCDKPVGQNEKCVDGKAVCDQGKVVCS